MKVMILGCGVIGVLSAYFLQKNGFEVIVIERNSQPAEECSFANGAQLSYSHAEPWASWPMVYKALKWLGKSNAPLYLRPSLDLHMYKWLWKFLGNCGEQAIARNTRAMVQLNFYSKKILHEILEQHSIDFDLSSKGILHIYTDKNYMASLKQHFTRQQQYYPDFTYRELDKYGCIDLEPALVNFADELCGGIYCMQDEIGDMYKFTLQMVEICKNIGVKFLFDTKVETFTTSNHKISGVMTDKGFMKADEYVAALGAYNYPLLHKIGINCSIYPMKGYSVTMKVDNTHTAPYVGITDEINKVVYSRIGENRIRLAGTAEFAGFNHAIPEARIKPILEAYKRVFPYGGNFEQITSWACLRPQTASNIPIIARTCYENLFINGGHGTMGWTMAAGSAKILLNIMQNNKMEQIDIEMFNL